MSAVWSEGIRLSWWGVWDKIKEQILSTDVFFFLCSSQRADWTSEIRKERWSDCALFAETEETQAREKYEGMEVVRCLTTFHSSFLLTWMTCCYGNNTEHMCESKYSALWLRLESKLSFNSLSPIPDQISSPQNKFAAQFKAYCTTNQCFFPPHFFHLTPAPHPRATESLAFNKLRVPLMKHSYRPLIAFDWHDWAPLCRLAPNDVTICVTVAVFYRFGNINLWWTGWFTVGQQLLNCQVIQGSWSRLVTHLISFSQTADIFNNLT